MTIEITLKLPNDVVERARQLGTANQRDLGTVLTDMLEMLWLTVDEVPGLLDVSPIAEVSDNTMLMLADSQMDAVQNQRLGDLQAKGKREGLTSAER